ncbi:hypothetical protein [Emticicia soli]|uniref:Lasso RiPP family leader peptide-containing protein n=1 Tax=Emticicia soli TaxID=2027878 RepID=A0ABW5J228_9BACT
MENNFSIDTISVDLPNEKKVWSTPELVILSDDIIKGSASPGDDGLGIFTAS